MAQILAGPMVRRSTPDAVVVWIATDGMATVRAEVYDVAAIQDAVVPDSPLGPVLVTPVPLAARLGTTDVGGVESRLLGRRLCVHLLTVRPLAGKFPTDTLLGYDVQVDGQKLADLGLTSGPEAITYPALPLPTFVLASQMRRLLHGSCRKLRGDGDDALANADGLLASTLENPERRPSVLFLTGDQVYADDVGNDVFPVVQSIAEQLVPDEVIPQLPPLRYLGLGTRNAFVAGFFKSSEASNHVLGFGEYAALYLLAFSPDLSALGVDTKERFGKEWQLTAAAVRRALANIVTYMAFDDHEITDDWNINADWRKQVERHPTGRRVVANGLAAYWAFQGWGNDPAAFGEAFKNAVKTHLGTPSDASGKSFETALLEFPLWAYATPTRPVGLVLDLRTKRGRRQSHLGSVEPLAKEAYRDLDAKLRKAGHQRGRPLLLVSPTPVLGHPLVERRQANRTGPLPATSNALDAESWFSNRHALPRLLGWMLSSVRTPVCVALSGDVHYGFHAVGVFREGARELIVAQITSSPLKNVDIKEEVLRFLDEPLGSDESVELGWRKRPPGAAALLRAELEAPFPVLFRDAPSAPVGSPLEPASRLQRAEFLKQRDDVKIRLQAEYRRMVASDEPLTLPAGIARDIELPRHDWRLARRFVPVADVIGNRQNVVRRTNLGDVHLDFAGRTITSTLLVRRGSAIDDRAKTRLYLRVDRSGRPASPPRARNVAPKDQLDYPGLDPSLSMPGERNCCSLFPGGVLSIGPTEYLGPDQIGNHQYGQSGLFPADTVGQIYTRRGGFIDLGHVRDIADLARYIASNFYAMQGPIILPPEGGERIIEFVVGNNSPHADLAGLIGARAAYQLAIWHEIVTWFTKIRYSSFSPEDNFSNLLGARIGGSAAVRPEYRYNESVDQVLAEVLDNLQAQPGAIAELAVAQVSGLWFDPDNSLTGPLIGTGSDPLWRRHVEPLPSVRPWLVTDLHGKQFVHDGATRTINFNLGTPPPQPTTLVLPRWTPGGEPLSDYYTLRIHVDDAIVDPRVLPRGEVTGDDLEVIVENVRKDIVAARPSGDKPLG